MQACIHGISTAFHSALHVLSSYMLYDVCRGAAKLKVPVAAREQVVRAGCLASRVSRATKKNTSKSTAAEVRAGDGGECTEGVAGELESKQAC